MKARTVRPYWSIRTWSIRTFLFSLGQFGPPKVRSELTKCQMVFRHELTKGQIDLWSEYMNGVVVRIDQCLNVFVIRVEQTFSQQQRRVQISLVALGQPLEKVSHLQCLSLKAGIINETCEKVNALFCLSVFLLYSITKCSFNNHIKLEGKLLRYQLNILKGNREHYSKYGKSKMMRNCKQKMKP